MVYGGVAAVEMKNLPHFFVKKFIKKYKNFSLMEEFGYHLSKLYAL